MSTGNLEKLKEYLRFLEVQVSRLREENLKLKKAIRELLAIVGSIPDSVSKHLEGVDLEETEEEKEKVKPWVERYKRFNAVRSMLLNCIHTLYNIYKRPISAEEIVRYAVKKLSYTYGKDTAMELAVKWDFKRRIYELSEEGKILKVGRNLFLPKGIKEKIGLEKYIK